MRKFVAFLFSVMLIVLCSACTINVYTKPETTEAAQETLSMYEQALQNAPQKIDEDHYYQAEYVLLTTDNYFLGIVSREDLTNDVSTAYSMLSRLGEGSEEFKLGNQLVTTYVSVLYSDLMYLDASDEELLVDRNLLADALGVPRK